MLKAGLLITWNVLFFSLWSYPQAGKEVFPFVDSFARSVHIRPVTDIYRLTKELTAPYGEQLLKARSIFIWVTDNIRYDYKFFNKGAEISIPECTSAENCEQVREEWERSYIKKILRRKKAVCGGYARLFKKMCDIAGIRCDIVRGYTKFKPYQVGQIGSVNHAWNVLWIDSSYYFVDATWAAGGCEENEETGKLISFSKNYNNYFWLTPYDDFFRDHYPLEDKWALLPGFTRDRFAANPYYAPDILPKIKLLSPSSGMVEVAVGDTIHFKFSYKGSISRLQLNSNIFRNPPIWEWVKKGWFRKIPEMDTLALKKQQYILFHRESENYAFDYVVKDSSLYYLEVLFDRKNVMKFLIKIKIPEPETRGSGIH